MGVSQALLHPGAPPCRAAEERAERSETLRRAAERRATAAEGECTALRERLEGERRDSEVLRAEAEAGRRAEAEGLRKAAGEAANQVSCFFAGWSGGVSLSFSESAEVPIPLLLGAQRTSVHLYIAV